MGDPKGLPLASDKYEVLRELGRGGMGVVYLARDLQLNREVALKVLYEHLNREHAFVERFREEARSVSTLHHPNIVCVHGLDCSGDAVAIDMEYVEGQSLDQFRRSSRLTTHVVASIANDVLGGLATCHQIGVVHRDIKPSNILIGQESHAKITDFGLATAYASHLEETVQNNTSSGFYMGTPRYMPVQAWEGERPEPFWDLYSFGVVLFELLSGSVAFKGDNPMAIMRKQLTDPLPPLATTANGVSPEFCALVDELLATVKSADTAPRSADALRQIRETPEYKALDSSNATATISLPTPPRSKRTGRHRGAGKRSGALRPLLAGLLVVVLIAGGIWLGQGFKPPPTEQGPPVTAAATSVPAQGPVFLNVTPINENRLGSGVWMLERDQNGHLSAIVGFTELELWSLAAAPPDGRGFHNVSGHWSAVVSAENRTTHRGEITGSLLWEPDTGRMTAHVERVRNLDLESSEFSLAGQVRGANYDRASFIRELESRTAIQGMLYQELMPRGLPWVLAIESLMPVGPAGRAKAPLIDGHEVAVDGLLDESFWTTRAFNRDGPIGELAAANPAGGPTLYLRWNEDAVYLGARIPDCGESPRIELGILPAFELSESYAPRLFATISEAGLENRRYALGDGERPWQFDWTGKVARSGPDAEFELRIPAATLGAIMKPEIGRRWRINARVFTGGDEGAPEAIVSWGGTEFRALQHGALLEFDGPPAH